MFFKNEINKFFSRFRFCKKKAGYFGVEREHFLENQKGLCAPQSVKFLKLMNDARWTYELSACQVEARAGPHNDFAALKLEMLENSNNGSQIAKRLNLRLANKEVGPGNMPLMVYPEPRYLKIAENISKKKLAAACRVAGTHIHIGMKNIEQAIAANNIFAENLDGFCKIGDHSCGERLRLYKTMAEDWRPVIYESAEHFFETALARGFSENPRNCWHLIRISVHGTVELRMFGVTDYADEIISWANLTKNIMKGV